MKVDTSQVIRIRWTWKSRENRRDEGIVHNNTVNIVSTTLYLSLRLAVAWFAFIYFIAILVGERGRES